MKYYLKINVRTDLKPREVTVYLGTGPKSELRTPSIAIYFQISPLKNTVVGSCLFKDIHRPDMEGWTKINRLHKGSNFKTDQFSFITDTTLRKNIIKKSVNTVKRYNRNYLRMIMRYRSEYNIKL